MSSDIATLSDEMTGGNTSDPAEAFEQWKQERQALIEFSDVMFSQEKLLERLGRLVDQIVPRLRSRKGVDWDKVNEVVDDLQRWKQGTVTVEKQATTVKETWKTLSMFGE